MRSIPERGADHDRRLSFSALYSRWSDGAAEIRYVEICGRDCVVIGRSNIVGKPMAMLLLHQSGTVTICHSKTQNLKEVCRRADILVAAVGIPKFVTADMVKPGAVVIDVGMDRDENGKLCGDVDFQNVYRCFRHYAGAWLVP